MERKYSKRTLATYLLSLSVLFFASSCVVYQNVPQEEDGIYGSEKRESRVIVANSDEHRDYENNYFTKELERIDRINGTDIFTDIENYTSVNDTIAIDSITDYTPNRAWGYGDSDDIVINIDLNNGGFGAWNLYDPYFSYGFYNPWFARPNFGWGFGGYGWGRWGRPFYNSFYNPFGPYHPFYHGLAGYRSARFWRYNQGGYYVGSNNYRYGRRYAYNNTFGRNSVSTRRNSVSSSRRNSSVYRRNSNTRTRNSNSNTRVRRRGTNSNPRTRRSSSTTRRRSTINRSSSTRSSRSVRSSSSSRRSSSGASRSSGSSRSSSSRSSGSRRRG